MFLPKYTISQTILKNIGIIDASRELIESLSLSESWKDRLKKTALENFIYYSLSIEGVKLPEDYFNSQTPEYPQNDVLDQAVANFKQTLDLVDEVTKDFKEK